MTSSQEMEHALFLQPQSPHGEEMYWAHSAALRSYVGLQQAAVMAGALLDAFSDSYRPQWDCNLGGPVVIHQINL